MLGFTEDNAAKLFIEGYESHPGIKVTFVKPDSSSEAVLAHVRPGNKGVYDKHEYLA